MVSVIGLSVARLYTFWLYILRRLFFATACSSYERSAQYLGFPSLNAGNFSASSCALMAAYSEDVAAECSPLHSHSISLRQVLPGLLKSQDAHTSSVTIAEGCSRLVRMMLGYIAATSRW